jgi:Cu2+-containing amine oxidase
MQPFLSSVTRRRRAILKGVLAMAVMLTAALLWLVFRPEQATAAYAILQLGQPVGFDPLSAKEMSLAQQIALSDAKIASEYGNNNRIELLLIERHEESKDVYAAGVWPRRADVFIYNYTTDTLIQAIVNLGANAVDSVTSVQSVQLPLTANETATALKIAFNDPNVNSVIRTYYQQATGQELANTADLIPFAFAFRASSLDPAPQGAIAACGLHRCGDLNLRTGSDKVLGLSVIVDLSAGQVVQVSTNQ